MSSTGYSSVHKIDSVTDLMELSSGGRVSKLWPMASSGLEPIFVSKNLLEHNHIHLFMHCLSCLHVTMAELSSYNRNQIVCKF